MTWLRARGVPFWLLAAAALACAVAAYGLSISRDRDVRTLFFVIDLTRSMTARDHGSASWSISRLDQTKRSVTEITRRLPCGSRVGLGVFTERRSFPLIEPVEVCSNFAPFTDAVDGLDWRMAWEGDSRVVRGLNSAQSIAADLDSDLVFITDGQEAPPLPVNGRRDADDPDRTAGLILGAGNDDLVPIPKYDDRGHQVGFYTLEDIASGSLVSIMPQGETREGSNHPRNNPVGNLAATSSEHLTSLKEDYLIEIAHEAGLGYARLADITGIENEIAGHTSAHRLASKFDLAPIFGLFALASLLAAYAWNAIFEWRAGSQVTLLLQTQPRRRAS
ncbi:vWA domain-containing protein [Fulvimarina sp. MAC8]|uniref:vWA domain-containing protein n=1 Tax=Fulvimarina sp. MAC8 TaxID=3162874 RepID=UPI0032EFD3EE